MTEGISLFLTRDLPEIILIKQGNAPQIVRGSVPTDYFNTPQRRENNYGKIN